MAEAKGEEGEEEGDACEDAWREACGECTREGEDLDQKEGDGGEEGEAAEMALGRERNGDPQEARQAKGRSKGESAIAETVVERAKDECANGKEEGAQNGGDVGVGAGGVILGRTCLCGDDGRTHGEEEPQ